MVADRSLYEAIPGLLDAFPEPQRRAVEAYRTAPQETTLAALKAIAADWAGERERAHLALAPTIPLYCSDDLMLGCRNLARDYGLRLHMHVAESRVQAVSGLTRYGVSLTSHLAALGMLGPDFTAAHAIWVDADDIARLADAGATVAHNPGSNLRLGAGIAPSRQMLDRGIALGIGTDGSHCSDHQNMFEAVRMASLVSRIRSPDPERWLNAGDALELATAGGARVLGLDGLIGRLAPGYQADIVFLDLDDLTYVPITDPVTQIVMAESGAAVESVMIGGRFVYRDRRFPGIDLAPLRQAIVARTAEWRARSAPTKEAVTALESYVRSFCIGLAREA
jgi:5-methylthioadenosine/S-adenosylhomocysteine deaminase